VSAWNRPFSLAGFVAAFNEHYFAFADYDGADDYDGLVSVQAFHAEASGYDMLFVLKTDMGLSLKSKIDKKWLE